MSNGYRTLSQHLNDLKKENFSLKLRIYFLEERMQQKYEGDREDIYRQNIGLKVEVESLKQELQDKQKNVDKSWTEEEKLCSKNEAEICRHPKNKDVCQNLEKEIQTLQEEIQSANSRAEKMETLNEIEKKHNLELSKQVMELSKKQEDTQNSQALLETYRVTLTKKDKKIEELTRNLKEKEQLLKLQPAEKQNLLQCLQKSQEMNVQNLCETNQLTHSDMSFGENETGLNCAKCIEKISCSNAMNKVQEELNEMNFKLKSVQHANQRKDHIIQKLNETLKIKENECEEQNHVIEKQNERITKLQEMLHKSQLEQLQNSEGFSSLQQKQQTECLGAQNALFLSQLEVQRLKWTQQQKDHQLAEARSSNQFLETVLQEEQLQKETAWKHSKEVCATLQQLKTELQNMNIHCSTLEKEKLLEMHRRDQKIMHLTYTLAFKEQLLQESQDLLQYHQNLEKNSTTAEKTIQKLQQLIKDKDAALKQAVDEKFCALEDKDQGMNQLYLSLKEQGHDLEGLRQVVSSNMATIQGLESLLKAKDLELEKLLATYNNLQWMMKNIEAKSQRWQAEQKGIIQQLQTAMLEQKKEVEAFSATLMCSLEPGQRDLVETLYLHLQQKDQIITEVLSEKSHQAVEQVAELQGLLQSAGTRDQQSYVHCREIAQAPIEINGELQVPHQQLIGHNLKQKPEISTIQIVQNKSIEALTQDSSGKNNIAKMDKDDLHITSTLERELTKAKEELELLAQKERESRLELSTLQSVVASQEEELQVQASDIESLTRSIKIKEELIKDLQMQLVDPEELPAIEQLTQEVLMLKEKVVKMELQGQEAVGCKKQQLLGMLEGLVAEKNQLNETLKVEKQIYCTLTKGHPNSSRQEQTLEVELEKVQALRGELEEAIGRSQELLSRLESLESIGDLTVAEEAEDGSTEFTDSIEEEAQSLTLLNIKEDIDDKPMGHSIVPALPALKNESNQQVMLHFPKSTIQQVLEQKKKMEKELQQIKEQIEEAGFSSISQFRKALLSLCLENAELKEQVGEAKLLKVWEKEDEKEDEEDLRQDIKNLQEKLQASESVIGLLEEQLMLNSQGCKGNFSQETEQEQIAKQCPSNRALGSIKSCSPEGIQAGGGRLSSGFGEQNTEPAQRFQTEGPQDHKLQDRLVVSEAALQSQLAQLKQHKPLLCDPIVQQNSKQIQVDLQDLGYETCGRSETEADREETTSPECRDHEEKWYWKKPLGSPLNRMATHEMFLDLSQCDDPAVLHQHVQALQKQLQNSQKVIRNLQAGVHSESITSDYGSAGEQPLKRKQGYTLSSSSPSHSMTDEDEGWHSDSFGTFLPPSLQSKKDLARLIQRVSLLEAHLSETKPKLLLPEELKCTASLGKYDSLVQAQARELSHLRQRMREGHGMCHMLHQHFKDTIKSFEELLQGSDIDDFLRQSFHEHLAEGNQLAERLARKLDHRNYLNTEDKSSQELLVMRLNKELEEKEETIRTLQAKLQVRSVTPYSSCTLSESPHSDSCISFLSDGLEGCSDVDLSENDNSTGQVHCLLNKDLSSQSGKVAAHPSCSTADCLSTTLSLNPLQVTSQSSKGGPAIFKDGAQTNHVSPLFHMQNFAEWKFKSSEELAESSIPWRTHPFQQPQEQPISTILPSSSYLPTLPSQKPSSAGFPEEHLFEIRTLCQRLEESLCTNDHLRKQLEIHLTSLAKSNELEHLRKALSASYSKLHDGKMQLQQQQNQQQLLHREFQNKQKDLVLLQKEFLALQMNNSRLQQRVMLLQQQCEENRMLFQNQQAELRIYEAQYGPLQKAASGTYKLLSYGANEQGIHVTGHLQDYNMLKKQILDSKTLIHQMASLLQPVLKLQDKVFWQEHIRKLLVSTSSLHQILEKSASLLAMFWTTSPPTSHISTQEQSAVDEIRVLRAKLAEQENRMQNATYIKGSMENFILTHLTGTYNVLKKARINLEGMSQQPKSISLVM